MTSLQDHTGPTRDISQVTEDALCDDWLGLAGYLAEAVAYGDLNAEVAGAELAGIANDGADERALRRAVDLSAIEFGVESLTTTLLAKAQRHLAAEVGASHSR